MRNIAKDVGITPMAIYRHYPDKDALMNALMLDGLAMWEKRAGAIRAGDPLQWLAALSEAFLTFALDEPRQYEAAFLLPATRARRYPGDFAAGRSPVIALVCEKIELAKQGGVVADVSAGDMALTMAALAQGLVSLHQAGRFAGEEEFRTAYRTAMHHCLQSFLRSPKA